MQYITKQGRLKVEELNSDRVAKINKFFDKLNELQTDLYELVFEDEDTQDAKNSIIKHLNSLKIESQETIGD